MKATLTRLTTSAEGTFGILKTDMGFQCVSGELPWRDNAPGKSCIPPGVYPVNYRFSPKHNRQVYHIDEVPNRSDCELHPGNFCGDTTQGFRSDVLGCILPGNTTGKIDGQMAVLNSKDALQEFEDAMNRGDFTLEIIWSPGLPQKAP